MVRVIMVYLCFDRWRVLTPGHAAPQIRVRRFWKVPARVVRARERAAGTVPGLAWALANVGLTRRWCDRLHMQVGEHAEMGRSSVKLYCPQCQDMYDPPRKCHRDIDGAYFGPSFPHLLMMVKPDSFQPKPFRVYTPRIYGFRVHDSGRNYPLLDRARTPAAARAQRAYVPGLPLVCWYPL